MSRYRRNLANRVEDIEYKEGDVKKCRNCGEPIVAVGIDRDYDYDYDESGKEFPTWREFYFMEWRHQDGEGAGSCRAGKTGPHPSEEEILTEEEKQAREAREKCSDYKHYGVAACIGRCAVKEKCPAYPKEGGR